MEPLARSSYGFLRIFTNLVLAIQKDGRVCALPFLSGFFLLNLIHFDANELVGEILIDSKQCFVLNCPFCALQKDAQ